jgi:hypothetical protein
LKKAGHLRSLSGVLGYDVDLPYHSISLHLRFALSCSRQTHSCRDTTYDRAPGSNEPMRIGAQVPAIITLLIVCRRRPAPDSTITLSWIDESLLESGSGR